MEGEGLSGANEILAGMLRKGAMLWSQDGRLHYKAPKGALSHQELAALRDYKSQILQLLPLDTGEPQPRYVPLSFSQLAHWNTYRLSERASVRGVVLALRLRGLLDLDLLRSGFEQLVRAHAAFRTRIVVENGVPVQRIDYASRCDWTIEPIDTPSPSEREIAKRIDRFVLTPIHVERDPLCSVRIFRLSDVEHVAVLGMEHMISDGASLAVISREWLTGYASAKSGQAGNVHSRPRPQFADHANWQRTANLAQIERESAYWCRRLDGCPVFEFPRDKVAETPARPGWAGVPIHISKLLKTELYDWCRAQRTTLAIGVLTAYIAFVVRWCDQPEGVVLYETAGRFARDAQDGVGYFAFPLYLRVRLEAHTRFVDALKSVSGAYFEAYEHLDYGCSIARVPQPHFARSTLFNWQPLDNSDDDSIDTLRAAGIESTPVEFDHPILRILELEWEPGIVLKETTEGIQGHVYFPRHSFSAELMRGFSEGFLEFLGLLLRRPEARVPSVSRKALSTSSAQKD